MKATMPWTRPMLMVCLALGLVLSTAVALRVWIMLDDGPAFKATVNRNY